MKKMRLVVQLLAHSTYLPNMHALGLSTVNIDCSVTHAVNEL